MATIRAATAADHGAIRALLVREGWRLRTEDPRRLASIVEAADRAVVADGEGAIVGFGRAVTDGVSNGYLSMVVVDSAHRRRGIGRAIVDALTGDDPRITWVLRAGREGSEAFWEAVGFRRSEVAMERVRTR